MQRRQQLGMSYMGILLFVAIFGAITKVASVIADPYYENYTINKIIDSLFRDGRAESVEDFKRGLSDRFAINNVRDKTPEDFKYTFADKKLLVEVDYEVRKPFIGNVDVVMHFKKTHGSELKSDDQ